MHKKLGVLLSLGVLLAVAACGGDDEKPQSDSDGGTRERDSGTKSSAANGGNGGKGGADSNGEGKECKTDKDCSSDLRCLKGDAHVADLKVCARPCQNNSDCDDAERCWSATGEPAQAFCWNMESEALKPCGPAFTSMCDDSKNLGCLRVEDDNNSVAGGVCLEPCKLKDKNSCDSGFSCLDLIDMPDDGLCVHTAKRDETCDEPNGKFCESGNLCLGDEKDSSWRCYQDCSDSMKCDDDRECKMFDNGNGGYCEAKP